MFKLWGRKSKQELQSEAPRLPRDEGWEPFSTDFTLYFMDCPIEIKRAEWEESEITTVTDLWPLGNCVGLYWRRTGLYKEREEREIARKVADRLLGKIRLTSINVASAGSGYGNSLAQMGGNSLGQQQNNGMLGKLLGSSGGSLGPSNPFDPDRWI